MDVFEEFLSNMPDPTDPAINTVPVLAFMQFVEARMEAHALDGRGESPLSTLGTRVAAAVAFGIYGNPLGMRMLEIAFTYGVNMFLMGYFAAQENWLDLSADELTGE